MADISNFIATIWIVSLVYGFVDSSDISDLKALAEQQRHAITFLKANIEKVAQQIALQQLYVEERIRSDGASGLKQKRATHKGTRNYFTDSYGYSQIAAVHDHSNYDRTVGMGELNVVLNGVDFRTRHNDYKLRMPSLTKKDYHRTDWVPFPSVPPSVSAKHTTAEQIQEMREYFKAFRDQDVGHRDFRPYFKPLICYLEGAWTTDTKSLTEPFQSDRHFLDAASWFDLQTKVRYTSFTGGKSNAENYSYLPTTITSVHNGSASFAQWNYRILCHPIKTSFSRYDLQKVNDVFQKLAMKKTIDKLAFTRIPRFSFKSTHRNSRSGSNYNATYGYAYESGKYYVPGILDTIMQEVPGVDNYPANLQDTSFGYKMNNVLDEKPLNTGYYHRFYKVATNGNSKTKTALRGFSDPNLFVAQTSSPRIAPMSVTECHNVAGQSCHTYTTRYTYAVPLEIIWLSPLYTWNPYNLKYYAGNPNRTPATAVSKDGRNGGLTKDKAYNGTNISHFYFTPVEFFHGGEVSRDPADTAKNTVGVLDQHGNIKQVVASGTKIILPDIPGVGKLRMRYQVVPIHAEGSPAWKELNALKEMVLDVPQFQNYFETDPQPTQPPEHDDIHLLTSSTPNGIYGVHHHDVYITEEEMNALSNNKTLKTITSYTRGHQHHIELQYVNNIFRIANCDGHPHCPDGHTSTLHRKKL